MEVGPTTHYMMGGVRVDAETGATTAAGLYAAGEVAGGMHGANRLGGNSLSDLLVFGQRAGAAAAADVARAASTSAAARSTRSHDRRGGARRSSDGAARRADPTARTRTGSTRTSRPRCSRWSGSSGPTTDLDEAIERLAGLRARWPRRPGRPAAAPTTRAGTWSSSCATC